jgi:hypothetical protein
MFIAIYLTLSLMGVLIEDAGWGVFKAWSIIKDMGPSQNQII